MAWNGSGNTGTVPSKPTGTVPAPSRTLHKVLITAAVVVAIAAGGYFLHCATERTGPEDQDESSSSRIAKTTPTKRNPRHRGADDAPPSAGNLQTPRSTRTAKDVAAEFNEQVRKFVKASTNNISWIVPPEDPCDPDNALRQRVTQELGSLLSIEPGDPVPPFPYSFLLEDDMRRAAAEGETTGEIDNGNAAFLEGLKKFRIVAKDGDDERRLSHKEALLNAQEDLLKGIDEGLSVNDTIRAAYEFRRRAYELREEAIRTMVGFLGAGDSIEDTLSVLNQMNGKFAEEGIKAIQPEEIGIEPEY